MTQKFVILAEIKPISIRTLKIGDSIIWGNRKICINSIDYQNRIVTAEHPFDELKPVSVYYKILNCIEEKPDTICPGCGDIIESLTDYNDEFCTPRCQDKYLEAIERGDI